MGESFFNYLLNNKLLQVMEIDLNNGRFNI